ncbi:sugar ABC transporter permease, partial [Paenibacillus alkaliterrae]|uniref:carbohydrate ABC transporter permease n=1 Tax=Paenibacillus alkaliterrae TaxID=320909 RepID=UPI001F1F775F
TSISQTMRLTFVSIVLELILGYMLAKFFINAKGIPGINVVRTIFILPMMIAPLVIGLMYMYVLNTNLGIVNYVLEQMGIGQISWFGNPDLALYTVIFINVWQWTPFMMILIIAGLNSIPESLVEVAKLEGATWWQKFINLEIPFISHVVAIGIFMRVMENLKMFDVVYATTNGGPGNATEVLSLLAYRQSFLYYQTGYGAAVGILILIMSTILVNVLFKIIWKKETV